MTDIGKKKTFKKLVTVCKCSPQKGHYKVGVVYKLPHKYYFVIVLYFDAFLKQYTTEAVLLDADDPSKGVKVRTGTVVSGVGAGMVTWILYYLFCMCRSLYHLMNIYTRPIYKHFDG